MIKKFYLSIILTAGLFLMSGCENGAAGGLTKTVVPVANAVKTYKIGVIAPLSGSVAGYGLEERKVLEYRLAELNKKNTFKIELSWEDGQCDAAKAAEAFGKMTGAEGIKFVIGGICSSETLGIAPLAEKAGAVVVSAMSSNPDIDGKSPNLKTLSYNDLLVGQGIAEELSHFKKVALITEKNDLNAGIRKVVEDTLASKYKDVKIVADEQFEKGSTDFKEMLGRIRVSKAEVILLNPNAGLTAAALIKQVGEAKLDVELIGQVAYNSADILANASDIVEGMVIIDAPAIEDKNFLAYWDQLIKDKGAFKNLSPYYVASIVDDLDLLAKLISDNNGDVDSVQKALNTGSFMGNIGKIRFDGKGFVQGVTVARYLVIDRKAVRQ